MEVYLPLCVGLAGDGNVVGGRSVCSWLT